jgi:hypothetical protein
MIAAHNSNIYILLLVYSIMGDFQKIIWEEEDAITEELRQKRADEAKRRKYKVSDLYEESNPSFEG